MAVEKNTIYSDTNSQPIFVWLDMQIRSVRFDCFEYQRIHKLNNRWLAIAIEQVFFLRNSPHEFRNVILQLKRINNRFSMTCLFTISLWDKFVQLLCMDLNTFQICTKHPAHVLNMPPGRAIAVAKRASVIKNQKTVRACAGNWNGNSRVMMAHLLTCYPGIPTPEKEDLGLCQGCFLVDVMLEVDAVL